MSAEDYELGRMDERINVRPLLQDVEQRLMDVISGSPRNDPATVRITLDRVRDYLEEVARCHLAAQKIGWYPNGEAKKT